MKGAHCPNCGKDVSVDADFCPHCGKEVKEWALEWRVKVTQRFPDGTQRVIEKALPVKLEGFRGMAFYKGRWEYADHDSNGQPFITVDAPLSDKQSSSGCASMFFLTFVLLGLLLSGISLTSCQTSAKALEASIAGTLTALPTSSPPYPTYTPAATQTPITETNWTEIEAKGTVAAAIATFLAVLFALFGDGIRSFIFGPKLSIGQGSKLPFTDPHAPNSLASQSANVEVKNHGLSTAKNVVGKVTKIIVGQSLDERYLPCPRALYWLSQTDLHIEQMDIHPGLRAFLTIGYATGQVFDGSFHLRTPNPIQSVDQIFLRSTDSKQMHFYLEVSIYSEGKLPLKIILRLTIKDADHPLNFEYSILNKVQQIIFYMRCRNHKKQKRSS
jgi:hypothetical protein